MKIGSLILTSAVCSLLILASGCGKSTVEENTLSNPLEGSVQKLPSPPSVSSQPERENMETEVLVTVDGQSLTRAMAMGMSREMAARQGVPPQMLEQFLAQMGPQMEQQAVEQFINQCLMEKEAARLDETITDEDIDAVLARITESLPPGMTLDQALAAQNVKLEDLRVNIATGEKMRKLYESKTASAEAATDAQVSEFYAANTKNFTSEESVSASHILISCGNDADEAAHAKAKADIEAILKQIEEGADFAEMAKEHSSCPSKEKGGSLGSFGRGRMVPEFEEAAFSQEIGKVGSVVKTQFGYHIIKVDEKTEGSVKPLEEVSAEIRAHLDGQAKEAIFTAFLNELRQAAEITYATGTGS